MANILGDNLGISLTILIAFTVLLILIIVSINLHKLVTITDPFETEHFEDSATEMPNLNQGESENENEVAEHFVNYKEKFQGNNNLALNTKWSYSPKMNNIRPGAAVTADDINIYVIGGSGGGGGEFLKTGEVFNSLTNTWSQLEQLNVERSGASSCVLNNKLYVIGGHNAFNGYLNSVEVLDLNSRDGWKLMTSLNIPRTNLAVTVVKNKIYALGGNSNYGLLTIFGEVFDVNNENDGWKTIAAMNVPRKGLGATSANGLVYVVGGTGYEECDECLNSVEIYNPDNNKWEMTNSMRMARTNLGVSSNNNVIYAVGGRAHSKCGGSHLRSVEVLDLNKESPQWETIKDSMIKSRSYLQTVCVNDVLYVIGGFNDDEGVLDSIEKHDILVKPEISLRDKKKYVEQPTNISNNNLNEINKLRLEKEAKIKKQTEKQLIQLQKRINEQANLIKQSELNKEVDSKEYQQIIKEKDNALMELENRLRDSTSNKNSMANNLDTANKKVMEFEKNQQQLQSNKLELEKQLTEKETELQNTINNRNNTKAKLKKLEESKRNNVQVTSARNMNNAPVTSTRNMNNVPQNAINNNSLANNAAPVTTLRSNNNMAGLNKSLLEKVTEKAEEAQQVVLDSVKILEATEEKLLTSGENINSNESIKLLDEKTQQVVQAEQNATNAQEELEKVQAEAQQKAQIKSNNMVAQQGNNNNNNNNNSFAPVAFDTFRQFELFTSK